MMRHDAAAPMEVREFDDKPRSPFPAPIIAAAGHRRPMRHRQGIAGHASHRRLC